MKLGLLVMLLYMPVSHASLASLSAESGELEVIGLLQIMASSNDQGVGANKQLVEAIHRKAFGEAYKLALSMEASIDSRGIADRVHHDAILILLSLLTQQEESVLQQYASRALALCTLEPRGACLTVLRVRAVTAFYHGDLVLAQSVIQRVISESGFLEDYTLDDLDFLARIYVRQGELLRADKVMERMLKETARLKKTQPLKAIAVYEHWLDYYRARSASFAREPEISVRDDGSILDPTGAFPRVQQASYTGATRPGPLLEVYKNLGLATFTNFQDRIVLLRRYLSFALAINHSSGRILQGCNQLAAELELASMPSIEKAQLFVFLGDAGIRIRKPAKALAFYQSALESPEGESRIVEDYFSAPVALPPFHYLGPQIIQSRPHAVALDEKLFAILSYNVDQSGRMRGIAVVNTNVAPRDLRRVQSQLSQVRFRPRLADGEFVETTGQRIRIEFLVDNELSHIVRRRHPEDQ
ncbi:MAG: hypothetical protein ACFHX7_18070 [Pseudomonadota bacterium]